MKQESLEEHEQRMRELKRRGPRPGMHDVADELVAEDEKRERDAQQTPKTPAAK